MAKKMHRYQAGGVVDDDDPYAQFAPADDPYADIGGRRPPEAKDPGVTPFPMEAGTSRASLQIPEAAGRASRLLPEDTGLGEELGMSAAMLMTTDPNEIGRILSAQYPGKVGVQHAPDGTVILNNLETGEQFLANKPGFSLMDTMQMLGLGAAYTPAGRGAAVAGAAARTAAATASSNTLKQQALAQARRRGAGALMAGSAATETAIQGGQELAGGEFSPADVALATATGALPDYVVDPLVRSGTGVVKAGLRSAEEAIPRSVQQALKFATETGRKVPTSQALAEFMTPAMNIFFKITERIPLSGTGGALKQQRAQRADALIEVADKFGIDVETDYGRTVMEKFVDRMKLRRFWGPNATKEPTSEMMERAWAKEADELTGNVVETMVRKGNIDEDMVDTVLATGKPRHMAPIMDKLMPEGQQAVRQRFIFRGLEHAGWTPGSPQIATPSKFMDFLANPDNNRMMKEIFSPEDYDMLQGAREYLRLTGAAETAGKGAGMTAAMSAAAGSMFLGIADAVAGGAAVLGVSGRVAQSRLMRGLLLKIAHTKGDEALTAKYMAELRPVVQAMAEQYQQEDYAVPSFEITEGMVRGQGQSALDFLEHRAVESGRSLMNIPQHVQDALGSE